MCLQCRENDSAAMSLLENNPDEMVVGILSMNNPDAGQCQECYISGGRGVGRGDLYPVTAEEAKGYTCLSCGRDISTVAPISREELGKTWMN